MKNGWTARQYAVYRVIFGIYLLHHFLSLLPWGTEIFSSAGVLPFRSLSPLVRLFPNFFLISDSPMIVRLALLLGAACSLLFVAGKLDRVAALVIWYLWASPYGRNPLIANPSLPFVGWLLLAHLLVPSASANSEEARSTSAGVPEDIYLAAWIVMAMALYLQRIHQTGQPILD